jgi:GMP synthase-like glutamine amidotransferase
MRALSIAHQADAGPGVFADAMRSRGVEHDLWLRPELNRPPGEPSDYDAVLVFGGAMHADQEEKHPWLREEKALLRDLFDREVPLLGVCLGAQLVAEAAGASARPAIKPEIGWHEVEVTREGATDPVLGALAPQFTAFQWHSYEFTLPAGATPLACSSVCLQAFRIGNAMGIQFHAEVTGADAEAWIDDYRSDENAVRLGLDPERLRQQTRASIEDWNALGRALCERFLDAVAEYRGGFTPT